MTGPDPADPDEPAWVAAGLLDPADDGALERRTLLRYLREQGAELEEMVAAHGAGRLFGLAGDRLVRPGGDRHSLRAAAAGAGLEVAELAWLWRALGLPGADEPLDPDAPLLADVDLAALPAWVGLRALVGDEATLGLARVIGGAAARIADATGSTLRRLGTLDVATTPEAATARAYAEAVASIPGLLAAFEAAFRHQVDLARRLTEEAGGAGPDGSAVRLAVAFTDLAGYTRLSASLDHTALAALLDTFADVASDVVRRHSGRVVKMVGDAVLFVAPRPADAARACLELLATATRYGLSGRAGAAFGPVLDRDGDVFGPVVNLAARLVAQAPDSALLVTAELADALAAAADLRADPVAPLVVRGYDDPVAAARVTRAP